MRRLDGGVMVVPGMVVHTNAAVAMRVPMGRALISPEIGGVAPVGPIHIKAVAAHRS
jgi:hypothetical protein